MFGLSVEQINGLASQLEAAGGEVDAILSSLTAGLASTPWEGKDRERFEAEWTTQHTKRLRDAAQAMRFAAQGARQNVQAQIQASGR